MQGISFLEIFLKNGWIWKKKNWNARLTTKSHQILFHGHSYSVLDFSFLSICQRDDGYVRGLLYANPARLEEAGIKPRCLCCHAWAFSFFSFPRLAVLRRGPEVLECVPLPWPGMRWCLWLIHLGAFAIRIHNAELVIWKGSRSCSSKPF